MFFIFPKPPQSIFRRRRVLRLVDCASEWGENLRYLVVSTMDYPEIAEYPDSNEASTGLRPWYPSFLRRNPPKHPPCLLRRSGRFGCEGRALSELRRVPLAHSSMDFRPWSFAQADKVGAYVTSASPASSRDFRALYVKDSSVPYFEGETCSEIESIKKSTR